MRRTSYNYAWNDEIFLHLRVRCFVFAKIHCVSQTQDFFSQTGKIEGLNNAITKHSKEKFLVPLPDQHNGEVTRFLEEKKIDYTESVMYRTVSNDFDKDEPFATIWSFFSVLSGCNRFSKIFPTSSKATLPSGVSEALRPKPLKKQDWDLTVKHRFPDFLLWPPHSKTSWRKPQKSLKYFESQDAWSNTKRKF